MTLCSVCRYYPAAPHFDLCEKCLDLVDEQDRVQFLIHWPVVEWSELKARNGRAVEVVAWL